MTISRTYWAVTAAAVALAVFPFLSDEWMIILIKLAVLTLAVLMAGAAAFLNRRQLHMALSRSSVLLLCLYLGWTLLTNTFFSSHPEYTLLGWTNWSGGWFTTFLFVTTLLLASLRWRAHPAGQAGSKPGSDRWLTVLFSFSALFSVLCILEMLGFWPVVGAPWFSWGNIQITPTKGWSFPAVTIGNSVWVAGIWVLLAPLPYLAAARSPRMALLWHALIAAGLASTHSKAALGLYAGMHVGVGIWAFLRTRRHELTAALLCLALTVFTYPALRAANPLLYTAGIAGHLVDVTSEPTSSATISSFQGRLLIWKATSRLIAERPLTGWGAETLAHRFFQQFTPDEYQRYIRHELGVLPIQNVRREGSTHIVTSATDPEKVIRTEPFIMVKPHNALLEEIFTNGFPGLLLITSALGLIAWQILKRGGRRERVILSGIGMYLAFILFSFTLPAVTPLACVLLAFAVRGSSDRHDETLRDQISVTADPAATNLLQTS